MTAEKKIQWTDEQARAVVARDSNVFVTASAGTGKTAVLSGRCVSLVSDADVCPDVLGMLVLTFTEAAAEQMRSRIARQLREAFGQTRDPRLGRQLILLQGADISTIHAFCKRLITEHFHALGLDPSFRVIDADEAMLLKAEVLDGTIAWAWDQPPLVPGLGELLRRRDLRDHDGFLAGIIRLSNLLEGLVLPEAWCDRARYLAEVDDPLSSDLGLAQRQIVAQCLDHALAQLRRAYDLHERIAPGGKWGTALQTEVVAPVAAVLARLQADDWQGAVATLGAFGKPKAPALRGFPEADRELIKDLRTGALESIAALGDLAVVNPEYMDVVGRAAGRQSGVLVELVQKFNRLYGERKMALNALDFADLEHYALKLLTVEAAPDGPRKPSETALALRHRYRHIFVDEYQDIDPVQQAILDALSSGDNVFVVGDVKQSIYAWRGAEPTIFLERLRLASLDPAEAGQSLRVDLTTNFRSARGILDFVNKIFGRLMTASLTGLDYDESARLRPPSEPAAPPPHSGPLVELHILDETDDTAPDEHAAEVGSDAETGIVRPRQRQAAMIAQRIKAIVGAETGRAEFQIYDKALDAYRDVDYGDIVILMRSLAKKASDYVEILRLAGIPVDCDATAGYFETTEISDVLCLLKVLDNPQRDIELAAVLRSAFFGLGDTELAEIRRAGREACPQGDFYACTVHYRDHGSEIPLKGKLETLLKQLDQWRALARRGNLADLLWRIYRETGYIAFVCALPNGQARKANLLKLHDRAIQFEGFASSVGTPSLTRFVEFIERIQEAGQDWTPASSEAAAGNAVRILSVHKSKGLEFPVVFLAELETKHNTRGTQGDLIANADDTLGLLIIDRQSNAKLSALAHQVISEKQRAVQLAEEMRILYVATTRARDRLILTALQKQTDCSKTLMKGLLLGGDTLPDWLLKTCRSPLEWILYGLADQRSLHEAFETGLADQAGDEGLFDLKLYGREDLGALSQRVLQLRTHKTTPSVKAASTPSAEGVALLSQLKRDLEWSYPFAEAVAQRAKNSVTQLTHHDDEFARMDYARALDRQPVALSGPGQKRPEPARVIGTATHLVISSLDLAGPVTHAAIDQTKDRLVNDGALTAAVAERVDTEAILAFFESELGAAVRETANTVRCEWPFTFGLPASERHGSGRDSAGAGQELVVVQGIIDMLVETPQGLIVIDFKTDRVSEAELPDRVEGYREQLVYYGRAAGAILERDVLARWLYFLALRRPVQV